ncbi:MAG TPA: formate--tetrahydrofolate ligase, partial [Deltaproteobacteria bacterium]|nr:formate--tetrahydrofolate ligase [Deltaproteobacteria bacterium]
VLVATWRAYALHGIANIRKHLDTLRRFGVPAVVSINRFLSDKDDDLLDLKSRIEELGTDAVITDFREQGGEGGLELAEKVAGLCERPCEFRMLYDLSAGIREKVETVAREVYGASGVEFSSQALKDIRHIENMGYAGLPVCIAKTPASLTDNPKVPGFPEAPFTIHVGSAKVSAGAGFVVIYTGKILSMPGLPKLPAALSIDIDENGSITGLF